MLKDLIQANRSCRGYDRSRAVKEEELREMVDCARLSASSVNKQPLKFCLIYEEPLLSSFHAQVKLGGLLPELNLPKAGEEPAAYIAICHDLNIAGNAQPFLKDVGIAAQSITLAAAEMGLAACMIGNFVPEKVASALGLADNLVVQLVISIGKGKEEIRLLEVEEGGSTAYYRDEAGVHCVPKRRLEDVILTPKAAKEER